MILARIGLLSVVLTAALALLPQEAAACGGTFCDGNIPGSMPVDQTGETILFAIDSGFVEAHIQIQYDGGDAEQFAWIVPVPEVPEIEIGSWRFVQSVLAGTVPVYGFEDHWICEGQDPPPPPPSGGGGIFIAEPDGGGVGGGGPNIVATDVVGAFEYAILEGGTSEGIGQWLAMNGYAQEEEAPEIFDDYIDEGHVFVAFKLRTGQGVEDIHPVVVRYPGTEPCIPIRLTRVAAKDDMQIRALFLGEGRVVPTSYKHVLLNHTLLNWLSFGANYFELVSRAIDEAGGRAFVTEYAGTSEVVDTVLLDASELDSSVFAELPVVEIVDTLESQGLAYCTGSTCYWQHELVSSLLHDFVPVPSGVNEGSFYSCLACYAGAIDTMAWDAEAFMAAYDERIVAPLQHAGDLLATWPYLTRLYTTISPHEMLSDPFFAEDDALADVPNRHGAERQQDCCGNAMRLPGGRLVWLDNSLWPTWSTDMPYAERIEEYAASGGAPIELENNSATIDQIVADWNATANCNAADGGESGDDGVADGQGGNPFGTSGGDGGTGGSDGDVAQNGDSSSSCACTHGRRDAGAWMLLALGVGLGLRQRRRS